MMEPARRSSSAMMVSSRVSPASLKPVLLRRNEKLVAASMLFLAVMTSESSTIPVINMMRTDEIRANSIAVTPRVSPARGAREPEYAKVTPRLRPLQSNAIRTHLGRASNRIYNHRHDSVVGIVYR